MRAEDKKICRKSTEEQFSEYRKCKDEKKIPTFLFTPHMVKHMKLDDKVLLKFLALNQLPAWYRGISVFQIDASNRLSTAIRDDYQQASTHRVRNCLNTIGLKPMANAQSIKESISLSECSDVAFLWFLMELVYKTPGPEYSINEQILMSVIAYLDIITTLRELDRILPPAQPPKKVIEQRKKLQEIKKPKTKPKTQETNYETPYFAPLVRRRPYGRSLSLSAPDIKANFKEFVHHKDPKHLVDGGVPRWFAEYQFDPVKRIATSIIKEQLGNIPRVQSEELFKSEDYKYLCDHHKGIKILEHSLEYQLNVIAARNERCRKYFDVNAKKREESRKRVQHQLQNDIALYMLRFRQLTTKKAPKTHGLLISGDNECIVNEMQSDASGGSIKGTKCNVDDLDVGDNINTNRKSGKLNYDQEFKDTRESSKGDFDRKDYAGATKRKLKPFKTASISDCPEECKKCMELQKTRDEQLMSPRTSSELYFKATTTHQPHCFNYPKIFSYKEFNEELDKTKVNIRDAFVNALDSDTEGLTNISDEEQRLHAAIKNCALKTWKNGLVNKHVEPDAEETNQTELMTKYDREYFNPDDAELMHKILKDAIAVMRKDKQFVLASMPDAEKYPMLYEWVCRRYGKTYTSKDIRKDFLLSSKIFKSLEKVTLKVPKPLTRHIGTNTTVSYDYREYLFKKTNYIKEQYKMKLDSAILDHARVFWLTMRPFLCENNARRTYFAYMPAGYTDITNFRPWKPCEYNNVRLARLRGTEKDKL